MDPDEQLGWKRRLEHGRLSMTAMEADSEYPGPGAAGPAAAGGGNEKAMNEAGRNKFSAAIQAVKRSEKAWKGRANLWNSMPNWYFVVPLVGLHFHKIHYDRQLRDAANKVSQALKYGQAVPQIAKIKKVLDNIHFILAGEWVAVVLLDVLAAALFFIFISTFGVIIYCAFHPLECAWEGAKALVGAE